MVKVLVVGASGRIGSAVVKACIERRHTVTAYVRTPGKLEQSLREKARVVQGDAKDKEALVKAMEGQDAVVQAAVYGSNTPWGTSDSEVVVRTVVEAAKERASSGHRLRLWVLSGQVLMDLPHYPGWIEGDAVPIHPEHYSNFKYMREQAQELDWSLLCPGKVDDAKPAGPIIHAVDVVPAWTAPGLAGKLPFIGPFFNVIYNWTTQKLSYASVGAFLADHLGPGGEMSQKRVCILEDWKKDQ
ncbi:unnamed protein product [Peniophora sp. CBMAI 1063]|nr:unnamed protein product [Peniophora sp. CBMAI 1063]